MPMTFAAGVALSKLLVQDTDTTDTGLTTTQWNELENGAMDLFATLYPERFEVGGLTSASLVSTTKSASTTQAAGVRSLVRAELTQVTTVTSLYQIDLPRMRYWQNNIGDSGTPKYWAWHKPADLTFDIYVYPISDGIYTVNLAGVVMPTEGSFTGINDGDDRCIAAMAAIDGAILLRRPADMLQGLIQRLGPYEKAADIYRLRALRPQVYAQKEAV